MSTAQEVFSESTTEPQRDWRDDLIDIYISQGFSEHSIVAQPQRRNLRRVPTTYEMGVYDYGSLELPHKTADDEHYERIFQNHIKSLRETYGEDNVVIAYATKSMIEEEGLTDSHQVVMLRVPEWQAETFARIRGDLLAPLTIEESRLTLNAVRWTGKALKQIFH